MINFNKTFEVEKMNFGKTALDYSRHRQGFPAKFFERLKAYGVGKPDQAILDLGTGTGRVARGLALTGAKVTGLDPAAELLEQAKKLDQEAKVEVNYIHAKAEETGLNEATFDVITAGQCWHWFDEQKAIAEVKRLLKPNGKLVIAHYDWLSLPRSVPVISEVVMKRYAPEMQPGISDGFYTKRAILMQNSGFKDIETFSFDHADYYTHEAWRGRIRASNWIGARLSPDEVARFDQEHAEALKQAFPNEPLEIWHRCFVAIGTRG